MMMLKEPHFDPKRIFVIFAIYGETMPYLIVGICLPLGLTPPPSQPRNHGYTGYLDGAPALQNRGR